ncbi:hypothetical protein LTR27_006313 [Elasticomyces elasticus]|nr:hypothetical protein LTR27_006313 [Elasticomyces elasticus]
MDEFNIETALQTFDKLVELGIVWYGPSESEVLHEDGFDFEIRICPGWSKKPLTVHDKVHTDGDATEPEMLGPGSDILKSHPDQVVGHINNTHIVAINIYPVSRPQYLLLREDSYRSQNEPLDLLDFKAAWSFIQSNDSFFVMYNCTKEAGCSRYHKHMQLVQKPEVVEVLGSGPTSFRFFPDTKDAEIEVPYVHFLQYLDPKPSERDLSGADILQVYRKLVEQCREALGLALTDSEDLCPHNVILVKEWILVIPRRRGTFNGVGANSAGMMGNPTVSSRALFETWKNSNPVTILRELGVPSTSA